MDFAPAFKNILPGYFVDTFWILFRYYTQHRFCIRFSCDCAEFWCVPAFSEGWNIEFYSVPAFRKAGTLGFGVFQRFGRPEHWVLQSSSLFGRLERQHDKSRSVQSHRSIQPPPQLTHHLPIKSMELICHSGIAHYEGKYLLTLVFDAHKKKPMICVWVSPEPEKRNYTHA